MKRHYNIAGFILITLMISLIYSCKKKEVPTLTTSIITNITGTSATSGGTITSEGSGTVVARGVCWSTNIEPTIIDNRTSDGAGVGSFISNMSDLNVSTTYFVRAYATNSTGTAYGNEVLLKTYTGTVNDIYGNVYKTVTIGTQIWMAENLRVAGLNDNTALTFIHIINDYPIHPFPEGPAFNFIPTHPNDGFLYTWPAVSTGKLCPVGWHVPTDAEWDTLILYLDTSAVLSDKIVSATAGGKMKESGFEHWASPPTYESGFTAATNESGFTALPGGYGVGYEFNRFHYSGYWWSATNVSANGAKFLSVGYNSSGVYRDYLNALVYGVTALSVRCIKDN